jgi:hypothetical protein
MLGTSVVLALAISTSVLAQQPTRIRGQIEKIDGTAMVLKTRDGESLNVKLADDARVGALNKATKADIKNDSFIGVAGIPQPDGSVKAYSIHIFMPAQRGVVPDRTGPWDGRPNSSMTNAFVGSVKSEAGMDVIEVKYKDGEKKIIVTPETAISAVAPGDKSELVAGAQIIIMQSEKQPDGGVIAKNIYVGRSLTPAM